MTTGRVFVVAIAIILQASSMVGCEEESPRLKLKSPDSNAYSLKDWGDMKHQVMTRLFLDTYKAGDKRNEAWDEEAFASIENYINMATQRHGLLSLREAMDMSEKALEAGCTDPIVQYAYAFVHDGRSDDVESVLREAIDQFRSGEYPGYCGMVAASRLARRMKNENRIDEAISLYDIFFEQCIESLENKEFEGDELRILFGAIDEIIRAYSSRDRVRKWLDRIKMIPDVDPWLTHMGYALLEHRVAWDVRGSGFSNSVTDDGWDGFSDHEYKAYDHLREAYELAPHRPESATMLIDVALGGHTREGEDYYYWFDRAMEAQFDWIPAYTKLLHAVRPRWHGSLEEMYELGLYAKQTGRYDTVVPKYLLHVLQEIAKDGESIDFWRDPEVYREVKEMIPSLIQHEPPRDRFNIEEYYGTIQIIFAWAAGEYEDAVQVRNSLSRLNGNVLQEYQVRRTQIEEEIHAYASNVGPLLKDAEETLANGNVQDALDHFRRALAEYEKGEDEPNVRFEKGKFHTGYERNVRQVLMDRIAGLQVYLDFNDGDWVDLTFDETLSGWWAQKGQAQFVDERTVQLTAFNGLEIYHRTPVGRRWEMTGKVDISQTSQAKFNNASIISSVRMNHPQPDYLMVRFYEDMDEIHMDQRGYRRQHVIETSIDKVFIYHVSFWDAFYIVRVNDVTIYAGPLPVDDSAWRPGPYFGIGGLYFWRNSNILFSDLRIRLLESPPEALREMLKEVEDLAGDSDQ